jgi:hypothetical protein
MAAQLLWNSPKICATARFTLFLPATTAAVFSSIDAGKMRR